MRITEINHSAGKVRAIKKFIRWAQDQLDITDQPNIRLTTNNQLVKSKRTFGTTNSQGEIWVYIANRNLADILRTLCHELVHYAQFKLGTAHNNMDASQTQKIEDEANALAGRMLRDYGQRHQEIYEAKARSLQAEVAAALPSTFAIPELKNNDPYLQYRFGVALAGAKGASKRARDQVPEFSRETPWGENAIISSIDPDIEIYIDDALQQMGLRGKILISTRKSEEAPDVGRSSPIKPFDGYPR